MKNYTSPIREKKTYYVYQVKKIDPFVNTASSISHDYTEDFNYLLKLRGYFALDYYISDEPCLLPNEVYFCGTYLIKIDTLITTFEAMPRSYFTVK